LQLAGGVKDRRAAGVKPKPDIVLDTRDGVFEAVANELRVGFTWEYGSSRVDKIIRIHVNDMAALVPQYVFCLSGKRYKLLSCSLRRRKLSNTWT
jgi:LysR family transcriptional regulator, low CO2-responsive transcriptional regulator